MSIVELPLQTGLSAYRSTVEIEGVRYVFNYYFNQRQNNWFLDILRPDNSPILVGTPLQTKVDLTRNALHLDIPKGLFYAYDTLGKGHDATLKDLGDRVKLVYEELN